MRRREFLTILSGAAMAPLVWPDDALAQQPRNSPTIGFLGTTTPTIWSANVAAFQNRLRELGWIDGRNVSIDIAGRKDVMIAMLNLRASLFSGRSILSSRQAPRRLSPSRRQLRRSRSSLPQQETPVRTGLVSSLSRPGGNVTGLFNLQTDLGGRNSHCCVKFYPASNGWPCWVMSKARSLRWKWKG